MAYSKRYKFELAILAAIFYQDTSSLPHKLVFPFTFVTLYSSKISIERQKSCYYHQIYLFDTDKRRRALQSSCSAINNKVGCFYKIIPMEKLIEYDKLRSISVEVETGRPISRRKYYKKIQSELIPKRTELKVIRLDEQIISSPLSANIVNLEFGQEGISLFKRANRKPPRRNQNGDQRKGPIMLYKQMGKTRYQNLLKAQNDIFCKQTIMITPYIQSINTENYLNDMYARRKLINIQKLTFPYREPKRQTSNRSKYRAIMNKTSRTFTKEDAEDMNNKQNFSHLEDNQPISRNTHMHSQTHSVSDYKLLMNSELKPEYKKEVSSLIPIRKPSNKKDYFVFGMSDRSNTPENKIEMYRDMLWKVNYSNGLYVLTPEIVKSPYKFYVGEGNNSNLIRGIMRRRFWWVQASSKNQQDINFVWTQLKVNSLFCTQETAALPQYFVIDKTQSDLVASASSAYKDSQSDGHKRIFGKIDYKIWRSHLSKNEKTQKKITQSTYQRRVKMYQKKKITKIQDSKNIKVHNHLQSNFYIGNKKALYYNIKRYLQLKGEDPFTMLPLTFHISKGIEDPEYHKFLQYYATFEDQKKKNKALRNMWIVKPGENTNRGNGITVCYGLDDIKLRLKGRERNADGKLRTFILQKYIQNPLLYNKRKFDLRHYILITCINGSFKGYWYEEGYVRTSSAEFNLRPTKDSMIHLTNDAIQKNNAEYGKYQKANKLSYSDLQKYIETVSGVRKVNFYEDIIPKMKHFATEAIKATYFILDSNRRKHNFQLLGLDFMIDQQYQPWLIQINTNPCLQLCCPLLQRLIPSVVQNTFKICVDPLYPPPEAWPTNRKPFFGDDPVAENKYELIFDQNSDGPDVEKLLMGCQKVDSKMGRIEQDDETFENDGQLDWQKD